MIKRLEIKQRAKGKNSDNMLLNEFIIENKEIFNELDCKWNYMPFLENSKKIPKSKFFPFCRKFKKKHQTQIIGKANSKHSSR